MNAGRDHYAELMKARRREHFVYLVFDANEVLLYVGCTSDPEGRFKAHRSRSYLGWHQYAASVEWVPCPDFATARQVEAHAIRDHQPLFNRHHNGGKAHIAMLDYLAAKTLAAVS